MSSASQLFDQALTLQRNGNYQQAEQLYRQVLQLDPAHVHALHQLGLLAFQFGRAELAVDFIRRALALQPLFPSAHNNLASILRGQGNLVEATAHYQEAVRLDPQNADTWSNLGVALKEQGRLDEAISHYQESLRLKPDNPLARSNLGNALTARGQHAEAVIQFHEALRLRPDYAEAYNNLGNALHAMDKFEDAIASYRQALRLKPGFGEAYDNLGLALQDQGRFEEAIPHHQQATHLRPAYAEAHSSLGNAYRGLGRFDEALASYEQALRLQPDHAEAHFNRSSILLLRGNLKEGWEEYVWRWRSKTFVQQSRTQPSLFPMEWEGSPLQGQTILMHSEQGLGDTIQFVRYAPLLKQHGAGRVILACPPQLARLMQGCAGIDQVVSATPFPPYDIGTFLMSLPRYLGTTSIENIPAKVPYLHPNADLVERWLERLAALDTPQSRLRVGIAWQGRTSHGGDRWRSVPLTQFAPLASVNGVSLISLQKGDGVEQLEKMPGLAHNLGPELTDMADTAAVMQGLDLVIAVDTAIVHLAGALAVPVWVAVPKVPDWRWLMEREDSPWYPSMRLFRQAEMGQWDEISGKIKSALENFQLSHFRA